MPVQPVDATPYNQLIRQYFPSRINLYASIPLEPKQGFVLFEFEARERNQPHRLVEEGFQQVLRRPIETTRLIGMWESEGTCTKGNDLIHAKSLRIYLIFSMFC